MFNISVSLDNYQNCYFQVSKQSSPHRIDNENMEIDLERPKTPEAHVIMKNDISGPSPPTLPFQFFTAFRGPSLIPPLHNPLFPHLPLPMAGFGHPPYIPNMHQAMRPNIIQPCLTKERAPPNMSQEISNSLLRYYDETPKAEKKVKEHKKEKRDKIKKKNKKDKNKEKSEKKKLKEEKKEKEKIKKEKKEKKKDKEVNNFLYVLENVLKAINFQRENEISVPKLTLKLGSASPHPEPERKLYVISYIFRVCVRC